MGKMDVVKSDAREVSKRVAVKKTTQLVSAVLAKAVAPGDAKNKKVASTRKSVQEALETENGKALVSILLGSMVPTFEEKIPEKHRELAKEIAQEARVQGEVALANNVLDSIASPIFQSLLDGVKGALDNVIAADGGEETSVRAELPSAKQTPAVADAEDVAAQKAALKKK